MCPLSLRFHIFLVIYLQDPVTFVIYIYEIALYYYYILFFSYIWFIESEMHINFWITNMKNTIQAVVCSWQTQRTSVRSRFLTDVNHTLLQSKICNIIIGKRNLLSSEKKLYNYLPMRCWENRNRELPYTVCLFSYIRYLLIYDYNCAHNLWFIDSGTFWLANKKYLDCFFSPFHLRLKCI
jgi:hypothetical protein